MSEKTLPLLIQSSRDALGECLADLERAVTTLEALERGGEDVPVRSAQLERARAQCVAAHRMLEDMARRLV